MHYVTDNRIYSALGNMPIWIQRCNHAMKLKAFNGQDKEYYQLAVLRDYMSYLVAG